MRPEIDILLATYNGEKYIAEQIESLQKQTFTNWRLLVSDDGSTDSTTEIVRAFQRNDSRIEFAPSHDATGSASNNFLYLLDKSTAPYVMFCDQDDVWLPEKISKTYVTMIAAEDDSTLPVAVYTDSTLADDSLDVIEESFASTLSFKPSGYTLCKALVRNICQGSTMMLNRALAERVNSAALSMCFELHDYKAAVIALAEGRLVCLDEATLLYRQHSGNVVGAQASLTLVERVKSIVRTALSGSWAKRLSAAESIYFVRAKAILASDIELENEEASALIEIVDSEERGYISRIRVLKKYHMQKELGLYQRLNQKAGIFFSSLGV